VESRPASTDLGFADDDNASGTVQITDLGSSVEGSFDAMGLENFGSGGSQGDVSGSFDARLCPALVEIAFEAPCGALSWVRMVADAAPPRDTAANSISRTQMPLAAASCERSRHRDS
jgi:hypothetical protein